MSHDHDRDHHDHDHHPEAPSPVEARALALESLLVEKGLLTSEEVDRIVSMYEHDIGPMLGANQRAQGTRTLDQFFRCEIGRRLKYHRTRVGAD